MTEQTNDAPANAADCPATPTRYVAIMRSCHLVSPDATEAQIQAKVLGSDTTVQEIMEWAESRKGLGASDIIIARAA